MKEDTNPFTIKSNEHFSSIFEDSLNTIYNTKKINKLAKKFKPNYLGFISMILLISFLTFGVFYITFNANKGIRELTPQIIGVFKK